MSTLVAMLPASKPISINNNDTTTTSTTTNSSSYDNKKQANNNNYREIIKQLAAKTATKPYGDIPPMLNKKNKKKKGTSNKTPVITPEQGKSMRRMSHVEDWIEIDSKESLPDEEELFHSPFRNFLSGDFFTEILPLHMPPPSLSERYNLEQEILLGCEEEEDFEEYDEEQESSSNSFDKHGLLRRHSTSSFQQKASPTSSTTTASFSVSSSPPHLSNTDTNVWKATLAKLKQTLTVSSSIPVQQPTVASALTHTTANKRRPQKLIAMPMPPKRPVSQKRRSEATTQPRFNPDTNTYTRDTRSNPDHLRMISAELNMMRGRKLLSPLKPRGFLPRRKDPFIRGSNRKPSLLINESY